MPDSLQDESESYLTAFLMCIQSAFRIQARAASIRSLPASCHHPTDQSVEARGH